MKKSTQFTDTEADRRAWRKLRREGDLSGDRGHDEPGVPGSNEAKSSLTSVTTKLGTVAVAETAAPGRKSLFGPKESETNLAPVSTATATVGRELQPETKPAAPGRFERPESLHQRVFGEVVRSQPLDGFAVSPPEDQATIIPGQKPVGEGIIPPNVWAPPVSSVHKQNN